MIYTYFDSYGGGTNNLHIARNGVDGAWATSLKSKEQAIKNLKRLLKKRGLK